MIVNAQNYTVTEIVRTAIVQQRSIAIDHPMEIALQFKTGAHPMLVGNVCDLKGKPVEALEMESLPWIISLPLERPLCPHSHIGSFGPFNR
jgi:hypothetical protein